MKKLLLLVAVARGLAEGIQPQLHVGAVDAGEPLEGAIIGRCGERDDLVERGEEPFTRARVFCDAYGVCRRTK